MIPSIAFQRLLARLQPLANASKHATSIRLRLGLSFRLKRFMVVGSHSRNTAIRHSSDIDYFAVLSRADARRGDGYISSSTLLDKIKEDLAARFWQTPVSRDGQATVVDFGGGDYSVDVVPSIFWEMTQSNWPIYQIPDGDGGWMPASPELHNKFIREADVRSGGKLRRTAQLVKFWRECRTPRVPISSFHLELLLASFKTCEGVKSYSQCLTETFQLLAHRECRAYRDPIGISGNVGATKTMAQQDAALRSVVHARDHAKSALEAELWRDYGEACRQWDIVFNGFFPKST